MADETKEKTKKPEKREKKPEVEMQKKVVKDEKEGFKYIVRMANTDLNGKKQLIHALTGIKGIGRRMAFIIANVTGLPKFDKIGNRTDEELVLLENTIMTLSQKIPSWTMNRQHDLETGEDYHLVSTDVDIKKRDDINLMKMIRCYRGVRHEKGKKVRGQRTKSHGRKGLTMGVVRKAVVSQAGAKTGAKTGEKK